MPETTPPPAKPLPDVAPPAPDPAANLGRPDEHKEGGPDHGRAAHQAERAEKARHDSAKPVPKPAP